MSSTRALPTACQRVRARLEGLVDGGLEALAEARDRGHLEACAGCAHELRALERLLAGLRRGPAGLESDLERVERAVLARLERERPARRRVWLRPVLAAAALLAFVLLLARDGGGAPKPAEFARFEPVLEPLPGWSEVLRGLGRLSRWIS